MHPIREQVDGAVAFGADMVELHTGKLANAYTEEIEKQELERLCEAAMRAHNFNLQVNAGGINYHNISLIHKIPHLVDLNIGHSIVARSSRGRRGIARRSAGSRAVLQGDLEPPELMPVRPTADVFHRPPHLGRQSLKPGSHAVCQLMRAARS